MNRTQRQAGIVWRGRIDTGIGLVLVLCFLAAPSLLPAQTAPACPPKTRVDNVTDTYGQTTVVDPYRWLEDQDSQETRAWIEAQDRCTEAALSKLPGREAITKRLAELFHIDEYGLPKEFAGRYFFSKLLAGQDLSRIYVRRGISGADELLVDPLPWSADHSASATILNISRDGKLLAYGRREGGQDEVTVHIVDVDTRKELPDVLPHADYASVEITNDHSAIYYAKAGPDGPRAFYHKMGTDPAQDKLIFGEKLDKEKQLALEISDDNSFVYYLVVFGTGSEKTEVYLQNLEKNGPVTPLVNDLNSVFWTEWAGNTLLLQTNWKAPQWHGYAVDPKNPEREHWKEVVPEADIKLDVIAPVGGKLVASYLRNATTEMKVFDADGKNEYPVKLPGLGTVQIAGRWGSPELRYIFTSFNYAPTVLSYNVDTKKPAVWAKSTAPVDPEKFQVEQVWYKSKDGTKIPMFLFSRKGLKHDSAAPVWLTAYGGFDLNITPDFQQEMIVWAEHGGIVAEPDLRGGGEFGEEWHRAGMLGKKQNVFDDFTAAAEFLIAEKYTTAQRLAIEGASNGGLLVGAALTQRPDLFQAVVCEYPLEDMLRFQKFLDGPYWVAEYGSSDDSKQFPYLYAYSPYHNVKDGAKYPAVLLITGDGDTRVAPLHARKFTARLQAATASDRPILLLYDTKSGHSGGRPVQKLIEEGTDGLSFMFWQLKVPVE